MARGGYEIQERVDFFKMEDIRASMYANVEGSRREKQLGNARGKELQQKQILQVGE